ncbi:MAG: peroxiredoxin family protein [Pseudomonadota bacterium]
MRTIFRTSLVSVLSTVFAVTALAHPNHKEHWGPSIGSTLPTDITVTTHEGDTVTLSDLATGNGLAIAFVRSADWCPFCKRQIVELNQSRDEFAKRGVNLVVLSYDSVAILNAFADEQNIGYTLVSDEGSRVINAFGIRNEKHEKGTSGYGIPHPGIMLFSPSGTLVAKFAEEGYRKRPPVEDVLAEADRRLVNQ